jgi:hypothetical protein
MFKGNLRHGSMGKCFFYNGDFYAGSWKNDAMDTDINLDGPTQDAIFIQNDGKNRYFGKFSENLKHGNGVEYQELELENGMFEILIYKGTFKQGLRHGKGELQVYRIDKMCFTQIDYHLQFYKNGDLAKT